MEGACQAGDMIEFLLNRLRDMNFSDDVIYLMKELDNTLCMVAWFKIIGIDVKCELIKQNSLTDVEGDNGNTVAP